MKLLNTPPSRVLFPQVSTLQEKLMKIHLYDDDHETVTETIPNDMTQHIEEYTKAVDRLIELQNLFAEKTQEIKDIKLLATTIESKTIYTEKLTNIIDDFCQDANLDQLQADYKEARKEVSKYRNVCSLSKSADLINRYICFVCVENPVDHCLDPCGHVMCSRCSSKIKTNCPFCRSTFRSKIKMYLD